MRIAIIGAGFSGIIMACRLLDAGVDDVVILEKASRPGGTWRDNVYPGVACDIPSHLYCWSEELNAGWTKRYAPGAEILQYLEGLIARRDLAAKLWCGWEVSAARWDGRRWHLESRDQRTLTADAVVAATGTLHHPAYPEVDGLDRFAGPMFHTARWPDDVVLAGRRVGVIGTGTTAAQLVASIAAHVGTLTVFQRTPSWILDVANHRCPGWQRRLLQRLPLVHRAVNRLATAVMAVTFGESFLGRSPLTRRAIAWRAARTLRQVRDPGLRARLTPAYAPGCKRLVFSSGYYAAIQRSNVRLVTERITRAAANGITTDGGEHHPLDVLIFATGFKGDAFLRPMTVIGENGITLDSVWAGKPAAYKSVAIPHMPNFFMLIGPHSPIANMSVIEIAEWQTRYITRCLDAVRRRRISVAPTVAATATYVQELERLAPGTVWASGCDSWYLGTDRLPLLYTRPPLRHRTEMARGPVWSHYVVRPLPEAGAAVAASVTRS